MEISEYIKKRCDSHEVKHLFSGKFHFFEVKSQDKTYNVQIKTTCDCKFMSAEGVANGKVCSHITAVLKKILE